MKTKLLKRFPATVILGLTAVIFAATTHAADKQLASTASRAPSPDRKEWNAAEWKDPKWKDPDILLKDVGPWDNLPLAEVARYMQDKFKGYFDVVFPNDLQYWYKPQPPAIVSATGQPLTVTTELPDVREIPVSLRLNNVTLTELFNAMNITFETENAPWRWQLVMNGNRPTAVFRILPEHLPNVVESPLERRIFFVGDMIGDEKSGGMTLDEIATIVYDICRMGLGRFSASTPIQVHKEAQLLIVSGSPNEIQFVDNALKAVKQKVRLSNMLAQYHQEIVELKKKVPPSVMHSVPVESKPKSEATKTP